MGEKEKEASLRKLNKEVLCMGIATIINNGDISRPEVVAEIATEISRLRKPTLLKLTMLIGIPLELLEGITKSRDAVRSRQPRVPQDTNGLPQFFPIIPEENVQAARNRLRPGICSNCGIASALTAMTNGLCQRCLMAREQQDRAAERLEREARRRGYSRGS